MILLRLSLPVLVLFTLVSVAAGQKARQSTSDVDIAIDSVISPQPSQIELQKESFPLVASYRVLQGPDTVRNVRAWANIVECSTGHVVFFSDTSIPFVTSSHGFLISYPTNSAAGGDERVLAPGCYVAHFTCYSDSELVWTNNRDSVSFTIAPNALPDDVGVDSLVATPSYSPKPGDSVVLSTIVNNAGTHAQQSILLLISVTDNWGHVHTDSTRTGVLPALSSQRIDLPGFVPLNYGAFHVGVKAILPNDAFEFNDSTSALVRVGSGTDMQLDSISSPQAGETIVQGQILNVVAHLSSHGAQLPQSVRVRATLSGSSLNAFRDTTFHPTVEGPYQVLLTLRDSLPGGPALLRVWLECYGDTNHRNDTLVVPLVARYSQWLKIDSILSPQHGEWYTDSMVVAKFTATNIGVRTIESVRLYATFDAHSQYWTTDSVLETEWQSGETRTITLPGWTPPSNNFYTITLRSYPTLSGYTGYDFHYVGLEAGIVSGAPKVSFRISPDPAVERVTCEGAGIGEIIIRDIRGIRYDLPVNYTVSGCTINVQSLPAGSYFVYATRANGEIEFSKFVKR